jgi:hypothetical protein
MRARRMRTTECWEKLPLQSRSSKDLEEIHDWQEVQSICLHLPPSPETAKRKNNHLPKQK